jgi:hypothetical protein
MRKVFAVLGIITLAGIAYAQEHAGEASTTLFDIQTNVVYIGTAYTKASDTTVLPSTNSRIWNITKITKVDGKVTGIYQSVTAIKGDRSMNSSVWADRATTNTIYKVAE